MMALVSLGVSLVGILSLFMLKRFERERKLSWYEGVRGTLDHYTVRCWRIVREVPHVLHALFSRILHAVVFYVSAFVLRVVRFVERKLFKFVNMVKGRHEIHRKKGSASLFLTSISDKKEYPHTKD